MGMKQEIYDGDPVFPEYNDLLHCPLVLRTKRYIPIFEGAHHIVGWDAGDTLRPAAVMLQVTPPPRCQMHALWEITTQPGTSMEIFAPLVISKVMAWVPYSWDSVIHVGDPDIDKRQGGTGETAGDVCRRTVGVSIKTLTNVWQVRQSAVTKALLGMIDEISPRFMLSGKGCPKLREGFLGKYAIRVIGKSTGDGTEAQRVGVPIKNAWSDPADALQYCCIEAWEWIARQTVKPKFTRRFSRDNTPMADMLG